MPVQYVALALTWGSSFLFVEIGFEGLAPGQVVLARMVVGAVTLAAVSVVSGRRCRATRQPGHTSRS